MHRKNKNRKLLCCSTPLEPHVISTCNHVNTLGPCAFHHCFLTHIRMPCSPFSFFFSISKRSFSCLCNDALSLLFTCSSYVHRVSLYFHWSLEESNFVDGSQLFNISNTVPYVSVLVHVLSMVVRVSSKMSSFGSLNNLPLNVLIVVSIFCCCSSCDFLYGFFVQCL